MLEALRNVILENLPKGFTETIQYKMPSYVVGHDLYPAGYHCDPKLPLPFISFASQKNYISFYHMGLYDEALLLWLKSNWDEKAFGKLDVGKCCVRLNPKKALPLAVLGELCGKITPQDWVKMYEENVKRK